MNNGQHSRKKSVEKYGSGQIAGDPMGGGNAPYQIYKHANGKIELRSISNAAPGHQKLRPSIGGVNNPGSSLGIVESGNNTSLLDI